MVVAQFKAALLQEAEADSVFAYSAKKKGAAAVCPLPVKAMQS